MAITLAFALAAVLAAQPGPAQPGPAPAQPGAAPAQAAPARPTRLFSANEPIRVALRGPIRAIVGAAQSSVTPRPARLSLLSPAVEDHAVQLAARGLTRRKREACEFPPLRVQFVGKPPATSLFERQGRLKLVTHCRRSPAFQQHVLLELAAYRLYNVMTERSLRVRVANVDYADEDGRPIISRIGFFIEDSDDAAGRNGMKQLEIRQRFSPARLNARDAARVALFQYMIGNLDWSMRAGPEGANCCHNVELIAPSPASAIVPVPYDFDSSGLVNAPYAAPPEIVRVASVRDRRYRGHCMHNGDALAAAADFRARRGALLGVLGAIGGLEEGRRRGAAAYLEDFFRDIADDQTVTNRLLRTCIS